MVSSLETTFWPLVFALLVGAGACQPTGGGTANTGYGTDVGNDANADQPEPDAGRDADNDADGGANGADSCDPQAVCDDYCREKYSRCLDQNCGQGLGLQGFGTMEHQLCMEGLESEGEDGEPETFIEGCVQKATESEETCREYRDDIEVYADQSCSSDEQQYRQCHELKLFLTQQGSMVYDSCGCTPASSGESCSADEECSAYDDGHCLTGDDSSICTAECNDFGGDPPSPILPDPSCADQNGVCMHLNETYTDGTDEISSMCTRYCTSLEDCPSGSSCAPVFEMEDDEALGLCTRGVIWDLDYELCQEEGDCPAGTACVEGTCQPACGEEGTACDLGECGSNGYCEINFAELF